MGGRLLFPVILLTSSCTASNYSPTVRQATVCQLHDHPETFLSQRIQTSGSVSAGLDWLRLFDAACPRSPIDIEISNERAEHGNIRRLWLAIYGRGVPGTADKNIEATVIGPFRVEKDQWPTGVLTVERVTSMRVNE